MKQYLHVLNHILQEGFKKEDRTGTGTIGIHGHLMRFDLQEGFPLLTTKKLHLKSIIHELLWFIAGDTNVKYLQDNGVKIWDDWADEKGNLGPIYGYQWRSWPAADGRHIDQLKDVIDSLTNNRTSRRHIISAWNVGDLDKMALPPCHLLFQFHTRRDKKTGKWFLDLQMYQRSCDTFLGVPFNIASYALFLMMMAQVCGYEPGEYIWVGGDVHIYLNHVEQCKLQLTRRPKKLPRMRLNSEVKSIFDFAYEDFCLEGYEAHPHIKGEISV